MDLVSGNFRLQGHIDVPEERIGEVRAALDEHIKLTREEKGCIFFEVEELAEITGRFTVNEAFQNEEAFQAHQTRAGNSPWAKASGGVPRDYKTWIVE